MFAVSSSRQDVDVEHVPTGCQTNNGAIECAVDGTTFTGVFDMDLRALRGNQTVDVTVTVTAPGYVDPNPGDNTAAVKLSLGGILGLILHGVVGEGAPLEPVGKLADDVLSLLP